MELPKLPFVTTDWSQIERVEHKGERGTSFWRTRQFGDVRIRMVEYSPSYLADHWCSKGHILLVLQGELTTELQDGRRIALKPGMSYQVGSEADAPHRSVTTDGATLFIVD